MPPPMFLFEIVVENLSSYVDCTEFYIKSQFSDVFTLIFKYPNDLKPSMKTMKSKKKNKVRNVKGRHQKPPLAWPVESGVSMATTAISSPKDVLITAMKSFPIEVSLFSKKDPSWKLGSTFVQWSPVFIDYLCDNSVTKFSTSVEVSGGYCVYDEIISKRVATIQLKIKLSHLKDKLKTSSLNNIRNSRSNSTFILNTVKKASFNRSPMVKAGVITSKTVYGDVKRKMKVANRSKTNKKTNKTVVKENAKPYEPIVETQRENIEEKSKLTHSKSLIATNFDLVKNREIDVFQTNSCSNINRKYLNISNYIFGDSSRPVVNKTYCVNYFTVENDFNKDTGSSNKSSTVGENSDKSGSTDILKFNICPKDCTGKIKDSTCTAGMCSSDLPAGVTDYTVGKCKQVDCENRKFREILPPADHSIQLDVMNIKNDCCAMPQAIEQVTGGIQAKMKFDEHECFCSCECTFGFVKHTTYCGVCGGFQAAGEDMPKNHLTAPFPCPIYHKLDKSKKTYSTSGSDRSKKAENQTDTLKTKRSNKSPTLAKSPVSIAPATKAKSEAKSVVPSTKAKTVAPATKAKPRGSVARGTKAKLVAPAASTIESEKDEKGLKKKSKRKDDRFKFKYGYEAPHIGHSKCVLPCNGTMDPVPKNMGWLWTAENVPGLKFRQNWKPGATHKHVVRLLKIAKHPGITLSKKKRNETGKKKKPLKRPLLTVAKKDGEYNVTMETMKSYPKQRARNQQPFEDKPLLNYSIGRTEEENRERKDKKERDKRRLERDQREFIQSAFSDMCKDICLKTYQQALGILPGAEDPDCPCYPKEPGPDETNLNRSCSCSDDHAGSFGSDTDSDEWILEFTPPNAVYDPTYKGKKVTVLDNSSQYTYLDYRVKLLDRQGNQVARFFKGPDGKTQCSDLGGFWSPEHKWLEINIDGYIGPDERWAPMIFIGPNGDQIDCENGKFQVGENKWLVVGVDGYVDGTGKWKFYPKPRAELTHSKKPHVLSKKGTGDKKDIKRTVSKPSEATWSCFGDANPKHISKMGIMGHGNDRKLLLKALQEMMTRGEDVQIPQQSVVPRLGKGKRRSKTGGIGAYDSHTYFSGRQRCKHPQPSDKGIIAVDGRGNKTYFKLRDYKNKRPKERIAKLAHHGISLSSFHVPCFKSFINSETMKKQEYERRLKKSKAYYPRSSESIPKYINEYRYIA